MTRPARLSLDSASSFGSISAQPYTVVFMGDEGVGKSSIISRFFSNQYTTAYRPTVEEFYREKVTVDGEVITLDLLDTSGSYEYPAMREIYIKKANVFVLVFTVGDNRSYERLLELRGEIIRSRGENAPMVIVGNKIDTRIGEAKVDDIMKELTITCEWKKGYVECSARDNTDIGQVFMEAVKALYNHGCFPTAPKEICAGYTRPNKRRSTILGQWKKTLVSTIQAKLNELKVNVSEKQKRLQGCAES